MEEYRETLHCTQHEDGDGNYICDYCEEYTVTDFVIANYNADTKAATVFVPKPGRYTLIFADYGSSNLEQVDIVTHDFNEGVNTVSQENKTFMLTNDDKVMLWYDEVHCVPICSALTLK